MHNKLLLKKLNQYIWPIRKEDLHPVQNIPIELELTPPIPPPISRNFFSKDYGWSGLMIATVCFLLFEVGQFFVCCPVDVNWSLMVKPTAGDRLIYG